MFNTVDEYWPFEISIVLHTTCWSLEPPGPYNEVVVDSINANMTQRAEACGKQSLLRSDQKVTAEFRHRLSKKCSKSSTSE